MGYTHYLDIKANINKEKFATLGNDIFKELLEETIVELNGEKTNLREIAINGDEDIQNEFFHEIGYSDDGLVLFFPDSIISFVKTNRKGYDLATLLTLLILQEKYDYGIGVGSDSDIEKIFTRDLKDYDDNELRTVILKYIEKELEYDNKISYNIDNIIEIIRKYLGYKD